jgi:hypothetical protein
MKFLSLFGLLFIFSSCVKNNPEPTWIQIEKWQLEANPFISGLEGELNHNFTDAYVYIDEKIIGIFELPIKLPLLIDGYKKIMIYPAIRNNGISASKKIYPFCQPHVLYATMVKGETITINPKTQYYTNCNFAFIEDFESAGIKFTTDPSSNAMIEQIPHTDLGKSGNCGHIAMTITDSIWTGYTHAQMVLPKGSAEVFLEIEYKTTNNVLTGVLGITLPGTKKINPNIQLNAQSPTDATWKKIYIDLKEIVSSSTTADYFEQYLQAQIDAGKTSSDIYIDNYKIIHF